MRPLSSLQGIQLIQKVLHLKLSREQLSILAIKHHAPVMVDACAGSGKTTLFLIDTLLSALTGYCQPNNMLGITFSKKAQLNMENKYWNFVNAIQTVGIALHGMPKFVTFHALFYRLLRKLKPYRHAKVITSWKMLQKQLTRAMPYKSADRSQSEVLQDIFDLRGIMINSNLSYDGIELTPEYRKEHHISNLWSSSNKIIDKVASKHWLDRGTDFYSDYYNALKKYNEIKKRSHWIDFDDMKTLLLRGLNEHPHTYHYITKIMSHYQLCYIDEFQDIDNTQWRLIREILPESTIQKSMVIGDDDQSIYAFRGGNPDIMLNYPKYLPNAKIMKLSTNYRTGGNILKAVKPLIERNKYRYFKTLQTAKTGQGRLIKFKPTSQATDNSGQLMFNDLAQKIKDPHIDNRQIAILVRYNSDRMFAIDWLASHKHYISTQKSNILQDNYVYRIFYSLVEGIVTDNLSEIEQYATRIGFSKYKQRMNEVIVGNNISSISQYARIITVDKSDDQENQQHDYQLVKTFLHFKYTSSSKQLWKDIDTLTKSYFIFMTKKNDYISGAMVYSIKLHFKLNLQSTDAYTFLRMEKHKGSVLRNDAHSITPHPINVLSLHQSKGLQFKYVYLYNLTDRDVKRHMVTENTVFAPNTSRADFLRYLVIPKHSNNLRRLDFAYMQRNEKGRDDLPDDPFSTLSKSILKHLIEIQRNSFVDNQAKVKQANRFINSITSTKNFRQQPKMQHDFNNLYSHVIKNSKLVEEERRLIYVGVTRAENTAYVNICKNASPLLFELR